MTAPAVPVLRLRDVDVVRDGTPLLRSISLTVHQGSTGRCSDPTARASPLC
ncbi:hypothetical protein SAMN04490356_5432 [Streptomyces melanosporofaciens]|uniref:Uncharacterized protein n=1 Tax=Streptomyces melanosporofaciens TaxID=67327 RepID=A0A1H4V7G3_STRMJ|nr:hypothetical protein SAMN04490356_5432 [Streptomyces melanosporofaciens]